MPTIEAFLPGKFYTEDDDPNAVEESDLLKCMEKHDVEGAIAVYGLLQKKGAELSEDNLQSIFEFASFYAPGKQQSEEYTEIRHFERELKRIPEEEKAPDNIFASKLYESIQNKTAATYNTRIRGLTRLGRFGEAKALYNKLVDDGISIDTETYNAIIFATASLLRSFSERWAATEDILKHMNGAKVKPDVHTMNATLDSISRGGLYAVLRERALSVLPEFRSIGVEPNLGTWFLVLRTFYKEQAPVSHILVDILKEIEGKEFKYESEYDARFFQQAMMVCVKFVRDLETAKRVDKLLNTGENFKLLGESVSTNDYYRNYLQLLLSAPFEDFLAAFHEIVPNLYSIDVLMFARIIQKIKENGQIEHIPLIYSAAYLANVINSRNAKHLESFLEILVQSVPKSSEPSHKDLPKHFAEMGWTIWLENADLLEANEAFEHTNVQWLYSAPTIAHIVHLLCKADEAAKAHEIMNHFFVGYKKNSVSKMFPFKHLKTYAELCVREEEVKLAIMALEYAVDMAFDESVELGKLITNSLQLGERDSKKLRSLLGDAVLKKERRK